MKGQALAQFRLFHPRQVHLPDDHPLVGDPEDHLLVGEPGGGPEMLQGLRHGLFIDDLAVADRTFRENDLAESVERDTAPTEGQLRRPDH